MSKYELEDYDVSDIIDYLEEYGYHVYDDSRKNYDDEILDLYNLKTSNKTKEFDEKFAEFCYETIGRIIP